MARNGKIARLPKQVRERLNRRLEAGDSGPRILDWLNGLLVVREVLEEEFNEVPVSEQNLSQWRQGGYQDWLRHREALEQIATLSEQNRELRKACRDVPVSDFLAPALALELARALDENREARANGNPHAAKKLARLSRDISRLRRDDHKAGRLRLDLESAWQEKEKRRKARKERTRAREEQPHYHCLLDWRISELKFQNILPQLTAEGIVVIRKELGLPPLTTDEIARLRASQRPRLESDARPRSEPESK